MTTSRPLARTRPIVFLLASMIAALLVAAYTGPALVQAHPFGRGADPFGDGAVREETPEQKKAREDREAKLREMWAIQTLQHGVGRMDWTLRGNEDESIFKETCFEAALSILHFEQFGRATVPMKNAVRPETDVVGVLALLANLEWKPKDGESRMEMFVRIAKENEDKKLSTARYSLGEDGEAYSSVTKKEWPLNWRLNRDIWLDVADSLLESQSRENPATFWKQKIVADEKHADLYRLCYLATARFADVSQFDEKLIAPFIREHMTASSDDLNWQVRVLETMVACGLDKEDPRRVAFRMRFLENLESPVENERPPTLKPQFAENLANLYRMSDAESEAQPMLLAVLNQDNPRAFLGFARAIQMPYAERYQWYMKKNVSVGFSDVSLKTALARLQRQVLVPTWIADDIADDETRITLKMTGSWKQALDAVLGRTTYQFSSISDGLFWIGNPIHRRQAMELVKHSSAKIPERGVRTAAAFTNEVTVEFVDVPLPDVVEYLKDYCGIEIVVLGDHKRIPVTDSFQGPLHLYLSRLAAKLEWDWYVSGESVIVGTKEHLIAFRKRDASREKRLDRIAGLGEKIAAALDERTKLEFIETPLIDVVEYLSDRHGVEVYLANDTPGDLSVTNAIHANLAWALDLMTYRSELNWDSDGNLIYIGNEQAIAEFLQVADNRSERRKTYPKDLADQLQAPAKIEFIETPLADVVKFLGDSTKVQIILDGDDAKLGEQPVTEDLRQPLDVALDMLCLKYGLDWKLVNGGVHIKRQ